MKFHIGFVGFLLMSTALHAQRPDILREKPKEISRSGEIQNAFRFVSYLPLDKVSDQSTLEEKKNLLFSLMSIEYLIYSPSIVMNPGSIEVTNRNNFDLLRRKTMNKFVLDRLGFSSVQTHVGPMIDLSNQFTKREKVAGLFSHLSSLQNLCSRQATKKEIADAWAASLMEIWLLNTLQPNLIPGDDLYLDQESLKSGDYEKDLNVVKHIFAWTTKARECVTSFDSETQKLLKRSYLRFQHATRDNGLPPLGFARNMCGRSNTAHFLDSLIWDEESPYSREIPKFLQMDEHFSDVERATRMMEWLQNLWVDLP